MRTSNDDNAPDTHTHTCARKEGKKKIFSSPSRPCQFPLLGFHSIHPFGLFAVYANFLLPQKQIKVSLERMYALASLAALSNVFHMCVTLVGRQLPCPGDIRCLGSVLGCSNLSRTNSLSLFPCPFINGGISWNLISFVREASAFIIGARHLASAPPKWIGAKIECWGPAIMVRNTHHAPLTVIALL